METDELLESQEDYTVPLLRLLAGLPGGQGRAGDVLRLFEKQYGHRIPDEHHRMHQPSMTVWQHYVHWSRQHLIHGGLVDSPAYAMWRITHAGRKWLRENPDATRFRRRGTTRAPKSRSKPSRASVASGVSLEVLEQTRKLMPADQFRQLWGPLYDQMLAEERARAISTVSQTELGRRARRWLDQVHAFLGGKNASSPSSEALCDWIHFCYALELYCDAAALLPYVREDEVDAVIFKRARRVAEACRGERSG